MIMNFFCVALGGAVGAVLRYTISLLPVRSDFPVLTLATNLLGAILIGFVVGIGAKRQWNANRILFWKTGVCGGFTTFSTFSLEAWNLMEQKKYAMGSSYIVFSVGLCVIGIILGEAVSRQV